MRELNDVLRGAFDSHARALEAQVTENYVAIKAVGGIRRRRAIRTAGIAGASVAATTALVFAAVAVPGLDDSANVATLDDGRPAWCDLDTYPVPNIEAFGAARYVGRVYADYDTLEFRYSALDGTVTELEEDAMGVVWVEPDGGNRMTVWSPAEEAIAHLNPTRHVALDIMGDGSAGGRPYLQSDYGPGLGYEWTTVMTEDVPRGVNSILVSEIHTLSIGFSGTGFEPPAAPADALVESIARWEDGYEEVHRIPRGGTGISVRDYTGLVSVATRVTLTNGEVFEVTSYYDESKTFENACGTGALVSDDTSASYDVDLPYDASNFDYGPYLLGPESALFQCGMPLPEGLEAQPLNVTYRQGIHYESDEVGREIDYGPTGFDLTVGHIEFADVSTPPALAGWGGYSSIGLGERTGVVSFAAFVWVDQADRIIARQVETDPSDSSSRVYEQAHAYSTSYNGDETVTWRVGDLSNQVVPCDGVDADAAAQGALVMIYGFGQSADAMEWSIFRPEVP